MSRHVDPSTIDIAARGDASVAGLLRVTRISSSVRKLEFHGPDAAGGWRAARRKMLTSTDIAPILGLAGAGLDEPAKTPFSIWESKVNPKPEPELDLADPENEAILWGNVLEEPVAQECARRLKRALVDHGRYTLFVNDDLPVPMGVSIDREILRQYLEDEDGAPLAQEDQPRNHDTGLLEIKTVGAFGDPAREWRVDGPVKHQVQLQHGLCVTQWAWGVLAGLSGSPAFGLKIHEHPRDDAFISWMLDKLCVFWRYVETRTPPPADDTRATAKALARFYDVDNGATIELPPMAHVWARELASAKRVEKDAGRRARGMKNEIMRALGEAKVGVLPAGEGDDRYDQEGGFRAGTISPKPTPCPHCSDPACAARVERVSYRKLLPFGSAKLVGEDEAD